MIPHRLNLLSPNKRQHLKRMVNFQFTKAILELILIFISIAGIIFLGGQWVLQSHFNDLAAHIVSVSNKYGETNQSIKDINVTLHRVNKIQEEHTLWTPLLSDLSQVIPETVILSAITFNKNNATLIIQGTATTRDDLLLLKDNLESLDWIKLVEIPPDQLTAKDNIQFALTPDISL